MPATRCFWPIGRAALRARIFIDPDPGIHNHWPVWSQDGRWIYFSRGSPPAGEFDLWRLSPDGGNPERLTSHNTFVAYPTPIGPRTVLYVARDQDGSGPWLWALDPERRISRRVSFGVEQYTSLTASADGRRLVATVANPTATLWTVPILQRSADERDVKRFGVPTVRALAPRFGGTSLFYLSSHGTGDGLWRYSDSDSIEIWKGADGPLLETPALSHDGRQVAFALRKDGKLRLHVTTTDGAGLHALGDTVDVQGTADWSPDGQWIVVGGRGQQGPGLFKLPVNGGAAIQLATGQALNPIWAPGGQLIVFTGPNLGGDAPLLAIRPDGTPVDLPSISVRRFGERARFLPDGSGLVYMQGMRASQDFWLLDFASMRTRRLTQLSDRSAMRTFDITPDGHSIVFDRTRENSDIVLIDLAP
jgi:Tol biopolymer transport system component